MSSSTSATSLHRHPDHLIELSKEDKIQLARKDVDFGVAVNYTEAARLYGVAPSTVRHRENGRSSISAAHRHQQKLSPDQEKMLKHYITECATLNFPIRIKHVKEMAEDVYGGPLSRGWVTRFSQRNNLRSVFAHTIDVQRAQTHTKSSIRDFLRLVDLTVAKFEISAENKFNMDKKGVLLGQANVAKILLPDTAQQRRRHAQYKKIPGGRESVTVIEAVSADGVALRPFIILRAQNVWEKWTAIEGTTSDWNLATSTKGWTDDDLGLEWLKLFNQESKPANLQDFRLLLVDNHSSYCTGRFIMHCLQNRIILIAFPPHSTHLFQPLDVGLFSPLQNYYSAQILDHAQYSGGRGVSKEDFLKYYHRARSRALTPHNIRSAFQASGIHPCRARPVLDKLNLEIPNPTVQKSPENSTWGSFSSGAQEQDATDTKTVAEGDFNSATSTPPRATSTTPNILEKTPYSRRVRDRFFGEILKRALSPKLQYRIAKLQKALTLAHSENTIKTT